jgi:hypothetical protein
MDYNAFAAHLFDVADLFCPATHARAYGQWLALIFELICCSNSDNYGVVTWRRLNFVPTYGIRHWIDKVVADMSMAPLYDPLASPISSSSRHLTNDQQQQQALSQAAVAPQLAKSGHNESTSSLNSAVSAAYMQADRRYDDDSSIDRLDLSTVGSPLIAPGSSLPHRLGSPSKRRNTLANSSFKSTNFRRQIPSSMTAAIATVNNNMLSPTTSSTVARQLLDEKNFDPDRDVFDGRFQPPSSMNILPRSTPNEPLGHHQDDWLMGGHDDTINGNANSNDVGTNNNGTRGGQRPLRPLSPSQIRAQYQRRQRLRSARRQHGSTSLTLAATPDQMLGELTNDGNDELHEYTMDDILRTEQSMTLVERRLHIRPRFHDHDQDSTHPFDIPLSPAPPAPPIHINRDGHSNESPGPQASPVGPLIAFKSAMRDKRRSQQQQSSSGGGSVHSRIGSESGRIGVGKSHQRSDTSDSSTIGRYNVSPWAATSGHLLVKPSDDSNVKTDNDDEPSKPAVIPRRISAEQQAEDDRSLRARVMARVNAAEQEKESRRTLSMSSNASTLVAAINGVSPLPSSIAALQTGTTVPSSQPNASQRQRILSRKWATIGGHSNSDNKTKTILHAMRTLPARRAFAALARVRQRLHHVFQCAWYNFRHHLTSPTAASIVRTPQQLLQQHQEQKAASLPSPSPIIDQLVPSRKRRLIATISARAAIRYDHVVVLMLDRFWLLFDNNMDGISRHQYVHFYMMAFRATFAPSSYCDRLDVLQRVADAMWLYDTSTSAIPHTTAANNNNNDDPSNNNTGNLGSSTGGLIGIDDDGSSKRRLSYQQFCNSLFEFVDVWCGTANVADFRHFLNLLYSQVTVEPRESIPPQEADTMSRSPSPPTDSNNENAASYGNSSHHRRVGSMIPSGMPQLRNEIASVSVGPLVEQDWSDKDEHFLSLPRLLSGHERETLLNLKWGCYLASLISSDGGITREERITSDFTIKRDVARAMAAQEDNRHREAHMIRKTTIHHLLTKHPKRYAHLVSALDKKLQANLTATLNKLRQTEALLNRAVSAQLAALPPVSFRQLYHNVLQHYVPAIGDPSTMLPPPAIAARMARADAMVAMSRELAGGGVGSIGMATDRLSSSRATTPIVIQNFRHEEQYALHRGLVTSQPNDAWQQLLMPEDMEASSKKVAMIIDRLSSYRMDSSDRIAWTSMRDSDARTPLHLAIIIGDHDSSMTLMQHGIDVNARDTWGLRAIDYALQSGWMEMIESLEHIGASSLTVTDVITLLQRSDLPLQPMHAVRILQQMAADGHTVNNASELILTISRLPTLSEQQAADLVEAFAHRAKLDLKWVLSDQLHLAEPNELAMATVIPASLREEESGDYEVTAGRMKKTNEQHDEEDKHESKALVVGMDDSDNDNSRPATREERPRSSMRNRMMIGDVDLAHAALSWRLSLLLVRLLRNGNGVIRSRLIALIRNQRSAPAVSSLPTVEELQSETVYNHQHEPAFQSFRQWLTDASTVERQFGAPATPMHNVLKTSLQDDEKSDDEVIPPISEGTDAVDGTTKEGNNNLVSPLRRTKSSQPTSPLKSPLRKLSITSVSGWKQHTDTPRSPIDVRDNTTTTLTTQGGSPPESPGRATARATARSAARALQRAKIAQLRGTVGINTTNGNDSGADDEPSTPVRTTISRAPLSSPRDRPNPEMIYTHERPSRFPRPFFPSSSMLPIPLPHHDEEEKSLEPPLITSSDIINEQKVMESTASVVTRSNNARVRSATRSTSRHSGHDNHDSQHRSIPTVHLPSSHDQYQWPYDIDHVEPWSLDNDNDELVAQALLTGRILAAGREATAARAASATIIATPTKQQQSNTQSPVASQPNASILPSIRQGVASILLSSSTREPVSLTAARPVLISLPSVPGALPAPMTDISAARQHRDHNNASSSYMSPVPSWRALGVPRGVASELPEDHPLSFALRIGQASTAVRFGVAKYATPSRITASSIMDSPVHAPGTMASNSFHLRSIKSPLSVTSSLTSMNGSIDSRIIGDIKDGSMDDDSRVSSADWSTVRTLYREPASSSLTAHQLRHRLHVHPHTLAFPHSRIAASAVTTTTSTINHSSSSYPSGSMTERMHANVASFVPFVTDVNPMATAVPLLSLDDSEPLPIHAPPHGLPLFQPLPVPRPPVGVRKTARSRPYALLSSSIASVPVFEVTTPLR